MYVSFLWHMHQPFYKDIFKKGYLMPWTFLHGIKDYYDMVEILNEFDNIKVTFNFVPSLLEQIADYNENPFQDYFLKTLKKEVASLTDDEKNSLIRQLYCINYNKMVVPYKRFRKLYNKKEDNNYRFTNEELLDLEVLYLIGWSGYYVKEKSQLIKELIEKGQYFSEEDKNNLLEELFKFFKEIIPKYREKINEGKIEISTSPYYHPILPLLDNMEIAKVAMQNVRIPYLQNSFKDDAFEQIKLGMEKCREIFEINCNGMWPSEGSVSEGVVDLIKDNNIKWIATDEDILFHSEKKLQRKELYYPYEFNNVKIFFRDRDISNLIGFIYSKWDYNDAANDLYKRIKSVEKIVVDDNAILSIILDGENAWEFYQDNGIPFLRKVYDLIEKDNKLKFTTFSEYIEKQNSSKKLTNLFPGSWINANYGIWVGHEEENKAWELIDKAKTTLLNTENKVKKENFALAKKELLIAEGSDWFWWYGDDFYSEMSDKFDSLFRTHIANVYSFLNEDIPFEVLQPIKKISKGLMVKEPYNNIEPAIDGIVTDYFEWISAGSCLFINRNSTMHYGEYFLTKMYFGFNDENLFIRLDSTAKPEEIFKNCILEINIDNSELFRVEYAFDTGETLLIQNKEKINNNIVIKHKDIIEIKIPFIDCKLTFGEYINITFEIVREGNLIERAPYDSSVTIRIPENLTLEYWSV